MIATTTLLPLSQKCRRPLKPSKSKTLGFSSFYLVALCSGPLLNVSQSPRALLKSPLLMEAFLVHPVPIVPFSSNLSQSFGPRLLSWQNHHCLGLFILFPGFDLCPPNRMNLVFFYYQVPVTWHGGT